MPKGNYSEAGMTGALAQLEAGRTAARDENSSEWSKCHGGIGSPG